MVYVGFPERNIFMKIDNTDANYLVRLKKIFPNQCVCFEAESLEELFGKILSKTYHRDTITQYCALEIFNEDNEIIFLFLNSEVNCRALQEHLGLGVIAYSNITTKNRPQYYRENNCTLAAIKKRITPNFVPTFISNYNTVKAAVDCTPYLPVKYQGEIPAYIATAAPVKPVKKTLREALLNVHLADDYTTDPDFGELLGHLDGMLEAFNSIEGKIADYSRAIGACDKKTLDMLHEIELNFSSMNAADGYKFAKRLHEVRILRRNAKDKVEIYSTFDDLFDKTALEKAKDIKKRLENRTYRNRLNKGMFDIEHKEEDIIAEATAIDEL